MQKPAEVAGYLDAGRESGTALTDDSEKTIGESQRHLVCWVVPALVEDIVIRNGAQ